ncbi:hypothetical protein HYV10_01715 [Candidatus Dependentiae bacterium]|nr:hypothetical protein [Candidatus Dependentiae bacterium]
MHNKYITFSLLCLSIHNHSSQLGLTSQAQNRPTNMSSSALDNNPQNALPNLRNSDTDSTILYPLLSQTSPAQQRISSPEEIARQSRSSSVLSFLTSFLLSIIYRQTPLTLSEEARHGRLPEKARNTQKFLEEFTEKIG